MNDTERVTAVCVPYVTCRWLEPATFHNLNLNNQPNPCLTKAVNVPGLVYMTHEERCAHFAPVRVRVLGLTSQRSSSTCLSVSAEHFSRT